MWEEHPHSHRSEKFGIERFDVEACILFVSLYEGGERLRFQIW